ncbi:MAG: hypothetical protein AAGI01_04615 [Myxococcota bacterium]
MFKRWIADERRWAERHRVSQFVGGVVLLLVFLPCVLLVGKTDWMLTYYERSVAEDIGARVIIESMVALRDGRDDAAYWGEELCAPGVCDAGSFEIASADVRAMAPTCLRERDAIGVRTVRPMPKDPGEVLDEREEEVQWVVACASGDLEVVLVSARKRWRLLSMRRVQEGS